MPIVGFFILFLFAVIIVLLVFPKLANIFDRGKAHFDVPDNVDEDTNEDDMY